MNEELEKKQDEKMIQSMLYQPHTITLPYRQETVMLLWK